MSATPTTAPDPAPPEMKRACRDDPCRPNAEFDEEATLVAFLDDRHQMWHAVHHAADRRSILQLAGAMHLVQAEADQCRALALRPADRRADLLYDDCARHDVRPPPSRPQLRPARRCAAEYPQPSCPAAARPCAGS